MRSESYTNSNFNIIQKNNAKICEQNKIEDKKNNNINNCNSKILNIKKGFRPFRPTVNFKPKYQI